jgi:hypothetical protein
MAGEKMTSLAVIEKNILWQQHVIKASTDPVQIARCRAALAKLEAERAKLLQEQKK